MRKNIDLRGAARGAAAFRTMAMAATSNSDSLPMFHSVAERFGVILSSHMRQVASAVNLGTHSQTRRFSDAVEGVPPPALFAVVKAKEWESQVLLALENAFARRIIALMQGNKTATNPSSEEKHFTNIQIRLIQRAMSRMILKAMSEAFDTVAHITFLIERIELQRQFALIMPAASLCVAVKSDLELEGTRGSVYMIFPHAALEPIREQLTHVAMGEPAGRRDPWTQAVQGAVKDVPLCIHAVFQETTQTLGQIVDWKVGDFIPLPPLRDKKVALKCGQTVVARGVAGKNDRVLAVQIDEAPLHDKQDTKAIAS